ncbi:MAG: HIT family protein [Pseudomonadota bacterium]
MNCELCLSAGGEVLWRDAALRVVLVDDADYPGFCRVIWNAHVREMTDLATAEREHLMRAVFTVEAALRELLEPDKINLASLGNVTPHLHWHVIPRFRGDPHFPNPVWGKRKRDAAVPLPPGWLEKLRHTLHTALIGN